MPCLRIYDGFNKAKIEKWPYKLKCCIRNFKPDHDRNNKEEMSISVRAVRVLS